MPRSIVQFLEDEIATLETELSQTGGLDILNTSDILILDLHQDVHGFDVNRMALRRVWPSKSTAIGCPGSRDTPPCVDI